MQNLAGMANVKFAQEVSPGVCDDLTVGTYEPK